MARQPLRWSFLRLVCKRSLGSKSSRCDQLRPLIPEAALRVGGFDFEDRHRLFVAACVRRLATADILLGEMAVEDTSESSLPKNARQRL